MPGWRGFARQPIDLLNRTRHSFALVSIQTAGWSIRPIPRTTSASGLCASPIFYRRAKPIACKVCTCTLVLWPFDRRIGLRHNVDQDGLNMRDRVLRIESKAALQLLNDGVG